jgi:hypothetical protein
MRRLLEEAHKLEENGKPAGACFAYRGEKECMALTDNSKCGVKTCPFFKTDEQLRKQLRRCAARLNMLEEEHER